MIPRPVPKRLGLTNIGTVGTTTVQKIAIQTPNKAVGTHLTHSMVLRSTLVSKNIMKMYVKRMNPQLTIKTMLLLPTLSTVYPIKGTKIDDTT